MNSGKLDPKNAPGGSRRWLPAAAAVTAALLISLWTGLGRDTSGAPPARDAAVVGAPALPTATDAPPPPVVAPGEPPAPAALASGHASLTVRVDPIGIVTSQPFVRVQRLPDGDTEIRSLGPAFATTWPNIPVGTYSLEALGDAWAVDEPQITLADGEVRTVDVSARRTAVVRVVGAFSGKLQPTSSMLVQVRPAGADFELNLPMGASDVDTDGRFVLLGLPSTLQDGTAIGALSIVVHAPHERFVSDWFTPAALEASPTVKIRVPEPVVVGQVRRAAAGDGLEELSRSSARVELRPQGDGGLAMAGSDVSWNGSGGALAFITTPDTTTAYSDRTGAYALSLASLPPGPVHVVASNGLDRPADSGPLTLAADRLPLHVDLVLDAGGVIRGTVRMGLGATPAGRKAALYALRLASAHLLGPDGAPERKGHFSSMSEAPAVAGDVATLAFTIGSLDAGDYEVTVELQPDSDLVAQPEARQLVQRTTVAVGTPARLEFDALTPTAGATVHGHLLLPPGLQPQNVEITLRPADGPPSIGRSVHADADGDYAFADLAPGACRLSASAWNADVEGPGRAFAIGRTSVRVEHGDVTAPPIDLTRPELRIHAASGARTVRIDDADGYVTLVSLDKQGRSRLFGLSPGHYTAHVNQADSEQTTGFDVGAGETLVTVELP